MAGRGRPAKPVALHVIDGKKHFSKQELEERKEMEIHIGDNSLECPDWVREDKIAYAKWKECKKIYESNSEMELVSSGDIGHLGRYCKTFAEYLNLVRHRETISHIELEPLFSWEETQDIKEELESHLGKRQAVLMWKKLEFIMSLGGLQALDKSINQKMSSLIAMEDRLFLNPLAKIKAIPKKAKNTTAKKKIDPLARFEGL